MGAPDPVPTAGSPGSCCPRVTGGNGARRGAVCTCSSWLPPDREQKMSALAGSPMAAVVGRGHGRSPEHPREDP